MSFDNGDFIKIDYSARRTSDNSLVYTTIEKVAREADIYSKDTRYSPQLVIVGKNTVIKGVDDAVRGMNVGEEKKFEVEPLNAFGERRDDMVSIMHVSDFRKKEIDPAPGMQVNIDGVIATIKSVNSGRVVVDANHPLAGESLLYEIKVVQKLNKDDERISALSDYYSVVASKVEVSGDSAKVHFDSKIKKDTDYFVNKSTLVDAIFKYFEKINKVVVDEEYEREKEEAKKTLPS